jgi:hypothetical protein
MTKKQENKREELITCKNCGTLFSGNYCNHCGQRADIERLNLKHLMHNFFHAFTHMDAGYLHTLKELAIRPGHSVREYLQGKRSNHSDPVLMLLIIGGLCSILYNHYHLKTIASVDISTFKEEMEMFTLKYFALAFLGYSLIFSLSDYFIFRYKGYNFTELFVMNIFTCIEILFFLILMVPVWLYFRSYGINNLIRMGTSLLVFGYLIYVRYQFFEAAGDKKALFRICLDAFIILLVLAVTGWKTLQTL